MIDYKVGDKVKINQFYSSHYLEMNAYLDQEAEVVNVSSRPVKYIDLSIQSGDRARFVGAYGKMDVYELVNLQVRYPDDNRVFMVSPFGFDKIKE